VDRLKVPPPAAPVEPALAAAALFEPELEPQAAKAPQTAITATPSTARLNEFVMTIGSWILSAFSLTAAAEQRADGGA
jgi:hypothetical protein